MKSNASTFIGLFYTVFCFFFINNITAQDPVRNKVAYVEFLGNGVELFSLNYDQRFRKSETGLGFKAGLSITNETHFIIPVLINYVVGKSKHKFEFGLGAMKPFGHYHAGNVDRYLDGIGVTGNISYRFTSYKGLNFRAGIAPFYNEEFFYYWPGISLGYAF